MCDVDGDVDEGFPDGDGDGTPDCLDTDDDNDGIDDDYFVERVTGDSKKLWKSLGHESLLNSYDEYNDFLQGRKKATFIRFRNLKEFPKPVTTKAMTQIIGRERMPQMGLYLTERIAHRLLSAGGAEIG